MMEIFEESPYSRVLVVGAGSGRDMASSVLVTERLRESRTEVDLAGFLTPWALHTFGGELERPVNELAGKESKKFLASREGVSLNSYFEPELIKLNGELGLGIGAFYLFSLQYGTERLREGLERLIRENSYDALIAVDVGGDILARRQDYPWLLTPIVDFSCLSILGGLGSNIDCYLAVVAPGVDGEIPSHNLTEIFDALESRGLVLHSEVLRKRSSNYKTFCSVSNRLNSQTGSRSNTFRLIEEIVSSGDAGISETLEKKISLKGKRWSFSFPLDLTMSLAKRMYYFDLKAIHSIRDIELQYSSILEAFVKLRQLGAGGTEVDLSFVPCRIGGGEYGDIVFLLTPPERVKGEIRQEILECGLKLTGQGDIPCSVMLEKDTRTVDIPSNLDVCEKKGGLCLVYEKGAGEALFEAAGNAGWA